MNKLMNFVNDKMMPMMLKISTQRHLSAVRDGLIATIPITIIGSIFILIAYLPAPQSYVDFLAKHPEVMSKLMIPFGMSMSLFAIYSTFSIGLSLAKSYQLDGLTGGVTALFTFLVSLNLTTTEAGSSVIMTEYLGGGGMFTGILAAFLAVEILRLCKKYKITIKLPEQVPSNVSSSFEGLIPIVISVLIVWLIVHIFNFNINALISSLITPLLSVSANSLLGLMIFVILSVVMWLFGIHPQILATIMLPVWMVNAEANMAAAQAGNAIPNIGVQAFIFTFIWIGGGGGTLSLCTLMCFSKSKFLKQLGRLSIVPGICNINEPLLFGLPIVLNPALAIPFVIAPIVSTLTTYFAFTTGLVPGMAYPLAAVWTVPGLFAGVIATASIKAAILVLINFTTSLVIYYPFYKAYENRLYSEEQGQAEVAK
ncbi:MAG: PTS transporter subunit EIIC [Streptococcaceae bacterium]|jgi:PTS system cellobiose-specific IIC component|nr:PTS transporter subunit EIIC [Streptococcaceae bacterium]